MEEGALPFETLAPGEVPSIERTSRGDCPHPQSRVHFDTRPDRYRFHPGDPATEVR